MHSENFELEDRLARCHQAIETIEVIRLRFECTLIGHPTDIDRIDANTVFANFRPVIMELFREPVDRSRSVADLRRCAFPRISVELLGLND